MLAHIHTHPRHDHQHNTKWMEDFPFHSPPFLTAFQQQRRNSVMYMRYFCTFIGSRTEYKSFFISFDTAPFIQRA